MPPRKQRTTALRDHVTSVAVEMLAREGVAGFTTRRIAAAADTSTPAVYELFGDKRGLVREMFFAGFRRLHAQLAQSPSGGEPRGDLLALLASYRNFIRENPVLAEVMFSRPFTDFEPDAAERRASGGVRILIVERVRRCLDADVLQGNETDIAHVLVSLVQGLAWAENARRLGGSRVSIERRWRVALEALLDGLAPAR